MPSPSPATDGQPPVADALPPVTAETTVEAALRRHPAALDAFVAAGFKPLLNPVLRKLLAGVTTLGGAARRKRWDEARLAAFLAELNALGVAATPAPPAPEPAEAPADAGERHPWGVFVDNRGLEPPMPMVRILALLETLAPGERLEAHNDRLPIYLLPRLAELGWAWEADERPDGSCRITMRRA